MGGDIDPEKLKGYDQPVEFAWEQADTLAQAFDDMADAIEGARTEWNNWSEHALTDFEGKAKDVFVQRHGQGNTDGDELVGALRDAAEDVRAMKRAAEAERDRRETAREWKEAYDRNEEKESGWNKFTDWAFGEDYEMPPEPDYPEPEPNLEAPPTNTTDTRV